MGVVYRVQVTNCEEAQSVTNFSIQIPTVPNEFELEQVTVMREKGKNSDEIYLNYVGEERGFIVAEKALNNQFAFGETVDKDDTRVVEVTVNGQQASLLIFKNDVRRLIWMTQDKYFYIEGKLTKDEIMLIAQSF